MWFAFVGVAVLLGALAQAEGPVAEYTFADPVALGRDTSGRGHNADVRGARQPAGAARAELLLDGQSGLVIPDAEFLRGPNGFTLEAEFRFSAVDRSMNLLSKEGEYLLRLDPPQEGGRISFFVNVAGSLEPRVRGPVAEVGKQYRVYATWDGAKATLWVNGVSYAVNRGGALNPQGAPVLVGLPSQFGPAGLQGALGAVRLYDYPLSDGEVLWRHYDLLDQSPNARRERRTRFEFADNTEGWAGRNVEGLRAEDGVLRAKVGGYGCLLLQRGLAVPAVGHEYLSLRMSATTGQSARLTFLTGKTPADVRSVELPLKADGRMHAYVVRLADYPEWRGDLLSLALEPSDAAAEVSVDFLALAPKPDAPAELTVSDLTTDAVILRAGRPVTVTATVTNSGGPGEGLRAELALPEGVTIRDEAALHLPPLAHGESCPVAWRVEASSAVSGQAVVTVTGPGVTASSAAIPVSFSQPVPVTRADYVPPPEPPPSDYLVGCHYCPLWKQGSRATVWEPIVPFLERKPALGYYDEDDPEVTDWEIKWALDHGIQYFVYCWYRTSQGRPVEQMLGHAIHDGLFNSRYGSQFKFAIMWENQAKGRAGIASEEDLLTNLLPFWIENYFRRDNYLKVDGKPLLFIYRPEFLVDDLGSVEAVRQALDKAREACRQAGLGGLTILGEYRGTAPQPLQLMLDEGLDYAFQYCWPVDSVPPAEAVAAQERYWKSWQEQSIIPFLITLSMGWDSTPWHPSYSKWRLPPPDFEVLCRRGKAFMDQLPQQSLGRKLVLLDNWNEYGEGHYIAPHRQYGFGYLDAVRKVFTRAPEPHIDPIPEDYGLGPYDKAWRQQQSLLELCRGKTPAAEGTEPDLIGWWTFDEEDDAPVALDLSGHGLGGILDQAARVPGRKGKALACEGGCVLVPGDGLRFDLPSLSVECWVRTDLAGQTDRWFVNCVFGTGDSGFRLGLSDGRLTWAIPQTPWSHHLVAAEALPLGKWVHVAATYDGRVMRLYQDGDLVGSLDRIGKVQPIRTHLCLGSYDRAHKAHFTGLLDEVRFLSRALTAEEVARRCAPGD